MKKCIVCKKLKSPTEFCKDKRTIDGLQSICKKCYLQCVKRWRKENPEKAKD